ncbi:MAG: Tripartite tricarboxylate transporter TctA family, partial [uncultured Craurococcus sp.]
GRTRPADAGLRRRDGAAEPAAHARRHRARRVDRRPARPRRRERHRHPAAADLRHAAGLGDHHAVLHLLGRPVRRGHHLDPVQHPRRALVGGDDLRRLPDGAAGQGRRGADGRLHQQLRRRLRRHRDDHLHRAGHRGLRAALRAAGVLRGDVPLLRQLRRHEQGAADEDRLRHDARLPAGRRRHGHRHRPAADDLRQHGDDPRLRLPRRRHRPLRHQRDPLLDRGRAALQGRARTDRRPRGAEGLGQPAEALVAGAAVVADRLLDGHHPGRRHARKLHVLWRGAAHGEGRGELRQGADRGRDRAGDRGACGGHLRPAADAHARRARLAHRGGAARRADHVGAAAGAHALRRAEGLRLGPDRLDVSRQCRRADRGAGGGAVVRGDPPRALLDHRGDHPRRLRDRGLHRQQCGVRHHADADLRRHRLRAEEARLPAGAAGARPGAGRPDGGGLPAVAADQPGQPRRVLLELAGEQHHGVGLRPAALAGRVLGARALQRPSQPDRPGPAAGRL